MRIFTCILGRKGDSSGFFQRTRPGRASSPRRTAGSWCAGMRSSCTPTAGGGGQAVTVAGGQVDVSCPLVGDVASKRLLMRLSASATRLAEHGGLPAGGAHLASPPLPSAPRQGTGSRGRRACCAPKARYWDKRRRCRPQDDRAGPTARPSGAICRRDAGGKSPAPE